MAPLTLSRPTLGRDIAELAAWHLDAVLRGLGQTSRIFAPTLRGIVLAVVVAILGFWAATMAANAQGAAIPDIYVISAGDELELDILDDSEPPQRFTVGGDGSVQLPYIGRLQVAAQSIADARDLVRETYVSREIFIDPGIALSVASFRPISVLGDVREPGNFAYQSYMTAEQAVGLAGGPAVAAQNEESRVLDRRSLEGSLNSLNFDLALASARLARANAQLAGRDTVEWTDLPEPLRGAIDRDLFDAQKPDEDRIISIERADFETRRRLMEDAVNESANQAALLELREQNLVTQSENAKSEFGRVSDIVRRGLMARTALNASRSAASSAENALLQLREQRSAALVRASELKVELSQIDAEREGILRERAQSFGNEVNKLIAQRRSIQERLMVLQRWSTTSSALETDLLIDYQVRRRGAEGMVTESVTPYDTLLPGDTLVITIRAPAMTTERVQ